MIRFFRKLALLLLILVGLNCLCIALLQYDALLPLLGPTSSTTCRVVYGIAGLAALWCLPLLFQRARR